MKKLFNPQASDKNPKLYNGDTTNTLNLVNVKYPKFLELVDVAYQNNWHFAKVDMSTDRKQYENVLSEAERNAYDSVISFLIFLDSIQTNNLGNIADYITLPEVVYFLARQTWDEALHSRSYAHILSNGVPKDRIEAITYKWREDDVMLSRITNIAGTYQESKDNPTDRNFVSVIIANFLLEGLYFYNSFTFFHTLTSRGLMVGTDTEIRYIQRDENVHCLAFKDIINILQEEEPEIWANNLDMVYEMFKEAVDWELKFTLDNIGNNILGITEESTLEYTYYLANKRLKEIGLEQIFPKSKNPYKHLDKIAAVDDESSNRSNQFEVTSIAYKSPEILDGWENL